LIIEDDDDVRTTLGDRLRGENYRVETSTDAEEAMEKIERTPYDLLIVDVMLPYHSGFDLCREIRKDGLATPILFLTAKTAPVDKIVGIKLGADDYVTKPFDAEELMARVEALLRRSPSHFGRGVHEIGPIRVDMDRHEVTRKGEEIYLTAREFSLLCHLMEHRGQTIPRVELLRAVWGYQSESYSRTVDVHIDTLRQKLEEDRHRPVFITTVSGVGYKFVKT
jgi:DNA-binding response OmpR family regulator